MKNDVHQLLERHFDIAFSAPDGIKKLRELILTLAMQGKLVAQDSNDPPASELLKEIEAEKKRLTQSHKGAKGNGGKVKKIPPIKPEDVPYELPTGWMWVRLNAITLKITDGDHKTPPRIATGYRLLSAKNVRDGHIDFDNCDFISQQHYQKSRERCLPETGDLLIVSVGGTIGRTSLVPEDSDFALVRSVALIKPLLIDSSYLKYAMDSDLLQSSIHKRKRGGAQPCLYLSEIQQFLFALAPLPEQRRIVALIDQLMARCDGLERLRTEQEQLRLSVHTAAIQQLLDAEVQDGYTRAWQFLTQHFEDLYTVKENVTELRKAILQLAVMGKLVPQDPNDPPASELLKEIKAEKQRMVKEGKIKMPKPLPEVKPEEMPYELPRGWEWVQFEAVVDIGSGVTKGRKLAKKKVVSIPYLRVANVQRGFLDLEEIKEIEIPVNEVDKYRLKFGDLLITEGGDWDKVGRTCIWWEEISLCVHQNHIFRARKILSEQNEVWLEKYLNSPIARIYFAGASKQTTNLASINKTQLRGCPVPIPPISEQHRIIAKINHLMSLCDALEQQIESATGKQSELLNSVMAQL